MVAEKKCQFLSKLVLSNRHRALKYDDTVKFLTELDQAFETAPDDHFDSPLMMSR
jgi:hypothetical protein